MISLLKFQQLSQVKFLKCLYGKNVYYANSLESNGVGRKVLPSGKHPASVWEALHRFLKLLSLSEC